MKGKSDLTVILNSPGMKLIPNGSESLINVRHARPNEAMVQDLDNTTFE